jgi:hypothetical protein
MPGDEPEDYADVPSRRVSTDTADYKRADYIRKTKTKQATLAAAQAKRAAKVASATAAEAKAAAKLERSIENSELAEKGLKRTFFTGKVVPVAKSKNGKRAYTRRWFGWKKASKIEPDVPDGAR